MDRRVKPGDAAVGRGARACYSGLRLDSLAIAAHFGRSAAMKAAKSCGVPGLASAASVLRRACISGDLRPALMAALSFATISAGVAAGAMTPIQDSATKS